jgi:hypothetical protein
VWPTSAIHGGRPAASTLFTVPRCDGPRRSGPVLDLVDQPQGVVEKRNALSRIVQRGQVDVIRREAVGLLELRGVPGEDQVLARSDRGTGAEAESDTLDTPLFQIDRNGPRVEQLDELRLLDGRGMVHQFVERDAGVGRRDRGQGDEHDRPQREGRAARRLAKTRRRWRRGVSRESESWIRWRATGVQEKRADGIVLMTPPAPEDSV